MKQLLGRNDVNALLLARDINEVPRLHAEMRAIDPNLVYDVAWGRKFIEAYSKAYDNIWIVLPFGIPPREWQDIKGIRYAHYCNDLIAISNPEFFTEEARAEVVSISQWLKDTDVILAISEHTKREIGNYIGLEAEQKTIVVYCAADTLVFSSKAASRFEEAEVRARLSLAPGDSYVLSVSTIEIRKNLEACVKAYDKLKKYGRNDIKLILTGMNGWKTEELLKAIERLDDETKEGIVFTGFVSDQELATLYRNASCFWYMSKAEGFGLPPLESMLCGTPVVCSNKGALPEVVGKGGILCDPNDYIRVALETTRIIDDQKYRAKFSAEAKLQAAKFDWGKSADNIVMHLERSQKFRRQTEIPREQECDPLISFITVSYNAEKTIRSCLDSISRVKQIISCEFILIDGNSNDGTLKAVKSYGDLVDKMLVENDRGIYDAMNKGLRLASGEYICFVNSDDELDPRGILRILPLLESGCSSVQVLATSVAAIGDSSISRWVPQIPDELAAFKCPNVCHNGLYVSRNTYARIGYYDTGLKIAADSEWVIRAKMQGIHFESCDILTYKYRLGGASSNIDEHAKEIARIASRLYPLLPEDIIMHLLYYNFTWQERKELFIESPKASLAECLDYARLKYIDFPSSITSCEIRDAHSLAHVIYTCQGLPFENGLRYMLCEAERSSSNPRLKLYALARLASLNKTLDGRMVLSSLNEQIQRLCDTTQSIEMPQTLVINKRISMLKNMIDKGFWEQVK